MKHKHYLDGRVAYELGMFSDRKRRQVSEITAEFIRQIRLLIAEQQIINVDGLGHFAVSHIGKQRRVQLVNGTGKPGGRRGTRAVDIGRATRVYFSKSAALKKLLEEKEQEKDHER